MRACLEQRETTSPPHEYFTPQIEILRQLFVLLFVFSFNVVFSQQGTVSGRIAAGDSALAGVTVQVKGTSTFTQTDATGRFSIAAPPGATLVLSSVGYGSKEIKLNAQTNLDLQLQPLSQNMNEVVVVGYGTQKRSTLSGAVSTITAKEMSRNPAANLSNSLVGQAPGIIAVQRSGEPGRDQSDIFIRGVGTTGNSSPLYVIDGIVSTQSDFAQISSTEIASVSVLKDAASAAVFGVRGGNGIILVTTRRGVSGRTVFSYNFNYGIQQRTRTPAYVGSYEYATLFNEAKINDGGAAAFTPEDLQKFQNGSDPDGHPNTNWYDIVLRKTAPIMQHNLSANGGTEKVRYAMSVSYLDQDGVYGGSGFKRYNFRSNLDADVTNTTRISFDIAGRNENIFEPSIGSGDLFSALGRVRPIDAAVFTNGLYSKTIQGNPLAYTQASEGYNRNSLWGMRARAQILQAIPFVKGLSLKGIAAFNKTFEEGKRWSSPSISLYSYNPADQTYSVATPATAPSLSQTNASGQQLTLEAHLNYERKFGDHRVSGLLLYTQTEEQFSGLGASRQQYAIRVDEINLGPINSFTGNSGYSGSSGRRGYVGRLNYTYNDKYIIEASFRRDASEQFAKEKRWGFFPSFSAGWVLSNESFFPKSNAVSFLKLRGSWGVLGNDRLSDLRFLYLSSYVTGTPAFFGNDVAEQTIYEGRLGNPNVTWETVKKLDIGLDATLLNGLFNITADYFFDRRNDILGQRSASIPALAGFNLPVENLAKVYNRGVDLALSHRNTFSSSFTYNITANFTYAKNEVIFIDEPAGTNVNIARTGRPLGSQFGYQAIGLFHDTLEINSAPSQASLGTAPKPGDIRYADVSGPGGKPDNVIDANDRTLIGRSNIPEIIYGLNGGIGFKGIEFSFLLQGSAHANQYLSNETSWPFFNGGNALKENFDRWTPATPNGKQPRVTLNTGSPNYQVSSFWMKDASYLRLRSVELAYNLPKALVNTLRLQGLRVYANANNVFTISDIKNFDPENGNSRGWAYPQLRIFNFGATVQF